MGPLLHLGQRVRDRSAHSGRMTSAASPTPPSSLQSSRDAFDRQMQELARRVLEAEPLESALTEALSRVEPDPVELVEAAMAVARAQSCDPQARALARRLVRDPDSDAVRAELAQAQPTQVGARWEAYRLAMEQQFVHHEVGAYVRKNCPSHPYLIPDLVEFGDNLLARRIVGVRLDRDPSQVRRESAPFTVLDFTEVAEGASTSGWVRRALWMALPNALRDLNRNVPTLTSSEGLDDKEKVELRMLPALGAYHDSYDALALDYLEAAHRKPALDRSFIDARGARLALDLPAGRRPLHSVEREALLTLVEADEDAALTSMQAAVTEEVEGLAGLWQDWTVHQVRRVTSHRYAAKIAEVVTREALNRYPRPSNAVLQRFRREVAGRFEDEVPVRGDSPGMRLAESFLTHEVATRSGRDTAPRLVEVGKAEIEDWPEVAWSLSPNADLPALRESLLEMLEEARSAPARAA